MVRSQQLLASERKQSKLAACQKLAEAIFAYREARGLSQFELSKLADVSIMVISRAERGFPISIRSRFKLNAVIDGTDAISGERKSA